MLGETVTARLNTLDPMPAKHRPVIAIVFLAVCLGIFLRLDSLSYKLYWHDEVLTGLRVAGRQTSDVSQSLGKQLEQAPLSVEELTKLLSADTSTSAAAIIRSSFSTPHFPLFYLLLRGWAALFSDSLPCLRLFSAVCSILMLGGVYLLGFELFQKRLPALISMAVTALAPFQLLYAQEMRAYSLLLLSFVLSSALLSQALRRDTSASWRNYNMAMLPAALTHFMFLQFLFIQITAVVLTLRRTLRKESRSTFNHFLISCAIQLLIASPWLVAILRTPVFETHPMTRPDENVGPYQQFFRTLVRYFSEIESHFGKALPTIAPILSVLIAVLVVGAVTNLSRSNSDRKWLALTMLLVPIAMIVIPDLLFGGSRGSVSRYMAPLSIGAALAVGLLIADGFANARQSVSTVLFVYLLSIEGISCVLNARELVWDKEAVGAADIPAVAQLVASERANLVLTNLEPISVISLATMLPRGTLIQGFHDSPVKSLPQLLSEMNSPLLVVLTDPEQTTQLVEAIRSKGVSITERKLSELSVIVPARLSQPQSS